MTAYGLRSPVTRPNAHFMTTVTQASISMWARTPSNAMCAKPMEVPSTW